MNHLDDTYHSDVHQVWLSYFLTGEQKSIQDIFFNWRQPKPKKNFSLKDGTWGAWEIAARYALHDTSEELFEGGSNAVLDGTNKGYSVTGGLRWTWNPRTRIMLDVNYLKSDEGKGIAINRNDEGISNREYKDTGNFYSHAFNSEHIICSGRVVCLRKPPKRAAFFFASSVLLYIKTEKIFSCVYCAMNLQGIQEMH